MADNKEVGLKVVIDAADSAKTVKELRAALKGLIDAQQDVEHGSESFKKLSKAINDTEGKIGDLNDSFNTLTGSGIERATSSFGLLKDGLRNLDFDKVKIGLAGLKTALASTGILLITAAVTYLIENFDELSKSTGALGTVLRTVGDTIKSVTNYVTDLLGITSESSRALNDLAEQNVANAEAAKEALASQTAEYDRQINAAKLAGKSTVDLEIAKQQAIINTNKALVEQTIAYVRQGGVLDDEKKKALNEQLEAIKGAVAQQNTIELTAQKERTEKSKAAAKEKKDDELKALKQLEDAKIENETNEERRAFAKAVLDRQRRDEEINALKVNQQIKNDLLIESEQTLANQLKAINDKAAADKKAIEDKAAADKLAQDEKNAAFLEDYYNRERLRTEKEIADKAEAEKKKQQLQRETNEKNIQTTQQALQSIQNVSDIFFLYKSNKAKKGSAEEEALARKQFQVNKALQLGLAVVDGYKAVTASLAQAPVAIGPAPNPAGIASLAFALTTSAVNIAKIAASQYQSNQSSASGGGGVGSPNIPEPPTISNSNNNINGTQFDEQGNRITGGQQNNQITVTAQVVESHMTAMQHSVSTIKQQAIF